GQTRFLVRHHRRDPGRHPPGGGAAGRAAWAADADRTPVTRLLAVVRRGVRRRGTWDHALSAAEPDPERYDPAQHVFGKAGGKCGPAGPAVRGEPVGDAPTADGGRATSACSRSDLWADHAGQACPAGSARCIVSGAAAVGRRADLALHPAPARLLPARAVRDPGPGA